MGLGLVTFEFVKPRSSLNTTRHIIVHTWTYASKCRHSACISTLSRRTLLLSNSVLTVVGWDGLYDGSGIRLWLMLRVTDRILELGRGSSFLLYCFIYDLLLIRLPMNILVIGRRIKTIRKWSSTSKNRIQTNGFASSFFFGNQWQLNNKTTRLVYILFC